MASSRRACLLLMTGVLLACGTATETATEPTTTTSTTAASTTTASTTTTSITTTSTTTTLPATTTTTEPTTTTTAPPPGLSEGSEGPEVVALQSRLVELGYWLDPDEGAYGTTTRHAVVAFQKREGLARDGVVGPLTLDALSTASRPTPQSATGHVLEVDLDAQTLLLVDDGVVQWVFDTSTGSRPGTTPRGQWEVFRQVDGYDRSPLGVLYRPKYFYEGVAVHGYPSVPSYPASHGCVRVVNAAMDWLWANDALPRGTPVWVY